MREGLIHGSTRDLEWNRMKVSITALWARKKALRVAARIQRGFVARWSWMCDFFL